jgi:DNA invertase Pin-like site-specific DNA recombinase
MLIGYARVSTGDQNLDLQKNALVRAECELIFEDTASGKNASGPGLKQAIRRLDQVIRWWSGNWIVWGAAYGPDYVGIRTAGAGVHFRSLTDSIDTSTPAGRFFSTS